MYAKLPLNSLNAFVSSAEHLSFQDAAEQLMVTPSAVSHQVRNLENILGYALFERLDKRIALTPQGKSLFLDLRAPFQQIHQASLAALRPTDENILTLSVAPIFATGWLLPKLGAFYSEHPNLHLTVVASSHIVNFEKESIDATIRLGEGLWNDIASSKLFARHLIPVCHPKLLEDHGGKLTPRELVSLPRVSITSMPDDWAQWFAAANIESKKAMNADIQVESSAQMVEALQAKSMVGLIDPVFFAEDLASGRLSVACDQLFRSKLGYFLTFPKREKTNHALQAFSDWITKQALADDQYQKWITKTAVGI